MLWYYINTLVCACQYLLQYFFGVIKLFNFGTQLKTLRQAKNLTQKQLALEIGASERGIQNYECNTRKPTYDMLISLADYFDVSIDYLVGRTDNPKINK